MGLCLSMVGVQRLPAACWHLTLSAALDATAVRGICMMGCWEGRMFLAHLGGGGCIITMAHVCKAPLLCFVGALVCCSVGVAEAVESFCCQL